MNLDFKSNAKCSGTLFRYVKAIEAWKKELQYQVFVMLSPVSIRTKRRRGKKQAIYVTMNKEQCLLALYITLDSVPFSQLLQFEGDAENTEENTLKAEKKPRTKFCDVLHLTG